jgi:hypothetical protein
MMNRVPAPVVGRRQKPEAVLEKMCRDLFNMDRDLFNMDRDLFNVYRDLSNIDRDLSNMARDLFNMDRVLFIIYRVLFGLYRVLKIAERVLFKPGSARTTMERTCLRRKGSIQEQKTTVYVKPWYETAANRGG